MLMHVWVRIGIITMVTEKEDYTDRLIALETDWKRILDVQRPYRLHMKSLRLGFVLDVGCGLGRNLVNLGGGDVGVGVDHNRHSVEHAKARGLTAFTPEEFLLSSYAREEAFDTILLAHVAEHMRREDAVALLSEYLPYLRHGGRVVLITPQEVGFRSDPTHVMFMDFEALASIAGDVGLKVDRQYSFPFPHIIGHIFKYNEFVTICHKP